MLTTHAFRAVFKPFFRSLKPFPSSTIRHLPSYRMASTLPNLAIFQAIANHDPVSTAIIHNDTQQSFSYGSLLQDVVAAKKHLSKTADDSLLQGERIAFLAENGYDYVGMGWFYAMPTSLKPL